MDRVTWDAVLARLDDALALCHRFGLGKEVAASRFIEYRRVVTGLVTALHDGGQDAAREEFHRDSALSMIALTEAAEFGDVGDFISQYGEHGVRRTLGRVLDGPVLPADEDPNSNDPRNRLFEFVIASKLWRAGLQPRLGDRPDVSCEVRGKTFFIECKRPLTARGVKGRITDAAAMLPDRIDATGGQALGVIALSLTRRLNLGDKLLVYRGEADGKEKLSRALATAAAFARSDWERLPGNIVGLLWHAITLIREFRGDGHIACLVSEGLDAVEALITHAASGAVPSAVLQASRAWSDDDWNAGIERLADRGLVDAAGAFTDTGAAMRQRIEDRTDVLALPAWEALGEDGCNELRELVRPWSRAIVDSGAFTGGPPGR